MHCRCFSGVVAIFADHQLVGNGFIGLRSGSMQTLARHSPFRSIGHSCVLRGSALSNYVYPRCPVPARLSQEAVQAERFLGFRCGFFPGSGSTRTSPESTCGGDLYLTFGRGVSLRAALCSFFGKAKGARRCILYWYDILRPSIRSACTCARAACWLLTGHFSIQFTHVRTRASIPKREPYDRSLAPPRWTARAPEPLSYR